MSILVACIGNIFQGDDAFGCEVAKVLAARGIAAADDVRVVDFGIRGLDLTYALLDAPDFTILVDTVSRGDVPGTLYTIEPNLNDLGESGRQMADAHAMNPMEVLRSVKAMGGKFGRILIVGCEPEDLGLEEGSMGLTAAVSAAVEPAAELVESLITKERERVPV